MKADRSTAVLRHLHALYDAGVVSGLTDGQLLERFKSRRAEASDANAAAEEAFAALVARHGRMVLGICCQALTDPDDIEDAFQATFLVLVRKAATIRVEDTLGRWLYGVARRVAARARAVAHRRHRRVAPLPGTLEARPASVPDRMELAAILDEELARLPEKYRLPLMLCYLVGLSNEEAAQRLGCPIGTVQSRLSRGREQLRARLQRRGLAPSFVVSLESLTTIKVWPAVPAALVNSTIRAAMRLATGKAVASEAVALSVAALAEGVLRTLAWQRLKSAVAIVLVLGATTGTVAAVLAQRTTDSPSPGVPLRGERRQEPGRPIPRMKTVVFPADRSLGVVSTRRPGVYKDAWGLTEDPWAGWEQVAAATRNVQVSTGQEVRLDVRTAASIDLSPLRQLNPDDLTALDFRGAVVTDRGLADISHLTGLRSLRFMGCRIDDAVLKSLSRLSSLRTLSFLGTPVGDDGLVRLAPLPSLTDLELTGTQATEKGVAILAKGAPLRRLALSGTRISDAGLAKLTKLREMAGLEHLSVAGTGITDEGLRHLANLRHLKSLDLSGTSVGDAGLAHLGDLRELEFLRLTDTKVTDAGLAHLQSMTSLKTFLPPPGITDVGLAQIGKIPSLRYLWITYSPITNAGLTHLTSLKNLETLTLDCTEGKRVTDEGVSEILKFPRLKSLSLSHTGIGDEGLAKLTALQALEALELGGGEFTWDGLRHLRKFPALKGLGLAAILGDPPSLRHLRPLRSLKRLTLNGSGRFQSDADLVHLDGLTALEYLRISGIPITDEGMKHLAGLTALRVLQIYDNQVKVGDSGLSALKDMRRLEYLWISGPITDRGLEQLAHLESLRFLYVRSRTIHDAAVEELKQKLPILQEVRIDAPGTNR